ncbi:MAG: prohibitin family protein [Caldilineaceae bacterium]|nr:prohibitin family protein [Caldilineaceae bacterium]
MLDLDRLLQIIAYIGWLFFAIYTIVVFVRTFMKRGAIYAFLKLLSTQVLLPLLAVIALNLLSAALVFIQPTEVGVVISLISPGGVRPQPLRAGLHFIVPILENEVKYPIYWQTYTMSNKPEEGTKRGDDSIRARTSDGQEVRLDASIIFRINQEQAVTLHIDWQTRYIEDLVRPIVRGLVRTQVSQFQAREVNSSARKDLEATLDRMLNEELAGKGLILDQFLLRDITFTDEYAAAIEQKQIAQEGMERTQHEAQQMRNLAEGERDKLKTEAEGRREKTMIEAEGEAKAILLRAEAQSQAMKLIADALAQNPDLLTYEYIQKLSPNIRAMLVPNDAPFILPLQGIADSLTVTDSITTPITTPVSATLSLTATMPITPTIVPEPTAVPNRRTLQ